MSATESTPPPVPDPDLVQKTLFSPPFVQIEGVFNVRDFGAGRPVSADATRRIKPLTLFRSGEVAHITERGIEQLRALAIAKVFDLRVDSEIAKNKTATRQIEGVDVVRAPIVQGGWGSDEMASRLKQFEEDPLGAFMRTYTQILECGTSALEKVLLHLRDHADVPCLIHCTGGKDRTGVFAAVILTLLGARDEDIVADYALTEVGMQPVLPMLAARLQKEPVFRDNWAGALKLGSSKPETMQAFLELVRREHGGVEGYLKTHTSLVDDISKTAFAAYMIPALPSNLRAWRTPDKAPKGPIRMRVETAPKLGQGPRPMREERGLGGSKVRVYDAVGKVL